MILFYLLSPVQGGLYDVFFCLEASVLFFSSIKNTKLFDMLPGIGVFGTGSLLRVLVPILKENGFKIEALWRKCNKSPKNYILFFTNKIDDVLLCINADLIFALCAPNLHLQHRYPSKPWESVNTSSVTNEPA